MDRKKVAVVGVLVAAVVAGYTVYGRSVEATLERAGSPCSPEAPIKVTIRNNTFKPIHRTDFKMEAWKGDVTRNVLTESFMGYTAEIEVPPFSSKTGCYSDAYFVNPGKAEEIMPAENGNARIDTGAVIKNANWFHERVKDMKARVYDVKFVER